MNKAIWYSRREPTKAEKVDAEMMGFEIAGIPVGTETAKISLETGEDVMNVVCKIRQIAKANDAKTIFGVFPPPIMGEAYKTAAGMNGTPQINEPLALYQSWFVKINETEGKKWFRHKEYVFVGWL